MKVVRAITPTLTMRTSQISYKSTVFKIYQGAEDAKKPKCVRPFPAFIPSKVAGRTGIDRNKEKPANF